MKKSTCYCKFGCSTSHLIEIDFHLLRLSRVEFDSDFCGKIQTRTFNRTGRLIETKDYYSLKNPTSSDLLPKVPDRKVIRFYYMHGEPGSTTSWYNDPNTMNPCPVNTREPALALKLDLGSFYFHPFKVRTNLNFLKLRSSILKRED